MGKLEIRNLESSKSHLIEDAGVVLGREGGDAEITLPDQGVSKKHARIYFKRGTWFLEDLDSANGTYLEDERIAAPAVLTLGSVFTMSRQQFEVVQILGEGEEAPARADEGGDEGDKKETNALEAGDLPDRLRSAAKGRRVNSGAELRRAPAENEDESQDPASRTKASRPNGAAAPVKSAARPRGDLDAPAPSLAAFGNALPRSLAHFGAAVPLMAANPLGSIRKGIAEQPLPALSNVELIAFALPPMLFTALVGAVCSAIAAAAAHSFQVGLLFPIVPLLSAIIGSVAAGLLCHPVLGFIIERLDGQSDARSRTNLFAMAMSASAVLALPGALATLLGITRVRGLALSGPLLMLAATGVMLFLWFSWFRYFGVAQWAEYAVLSLGALGVIGAVYSLVMTSVHAFSRPIPEAAEVVETMPAPEPEKATPPPAEPKPAPTPPAAQTQVAAATPTPAATATPAAATAPVTPPPETKPVSRTTQPTFADYRTMRAAVEKALDDDPALLRDRPKVVRLYRDLLIATKAAQSRFRPTEKNPAADQINVHLRNLEVYNATWLIVIDLNNALGAR